MSHTPGPWIADGKIVHAENGSALYIAECQNVGVGERWSGSDYASEPHAEANARLIAAAPDLLEALIEERRIRLLGQQPYVHWESLRDARRDCYAKTDAAIAKAKGETA